MRSPLRACVVIPAFNEEKSIHEVVRRTKRVCPGIEVVVVDDGSTDMTAKLAEEAGAHVIRLGKNVGQWEALRTGFRYALEMGSEILISMDGDGQHDPADIPRLLEPILNGSTDLVMGSRLLGRSRPPGMRFYRYVGIKFFSKLMSLITGWRITDVMSGYRAYRASLLKRIIGKLKEKQYGILEATIAAWRAGARVCEKPIRFKGRSESRKGSLRFLLNLLRVLLRSLMGL